LKCDGEGGELGLEEPVVSEVADLVQAYVEGWGNAGLSELEQSIIYSG
jgi:hypothetical protein